MTDQDPTGQDPTGQDPTEPPPGVCGICGDCVAVAGDDEDSVPVAFRVLEHIRLMHPREYEEYGGGLQTWPDGGAVIIDTSLSPEDFTDGTNS